MARALGLLFPVLIACASCSSRDPDLVRLQSARDALARGKTTEAQEFAREIAPGAAAWEEGQLILGAVAQRSGNWKSAIEYYRSIPRESSLYPAALIEAIAVEKGRGSVHAAIRDLEAYLQLRPQDTAARSTLANLLASTGQRRLADAHFWILVAADTFEFKQLVMLTDFDRRDPNESAFLEWCEQRSPRDAAVQTGLAVEAFAKGDLPAARRRAELAVTLDPLLSAAQGLLGELLVDEGDDEFHRWYRRLPPAIREEPEIWYARALWAQRQDQPGMAAHCFRVAAQSMPASYRVVYQLGLADLQLNPTGGGAMLEYARSLFDLRQNLSRFLNTPGGNRDALKRVVELLAETGREWEARCWARHAREKLQAVPWADPILKRVPNNAPESGSRFVESRNPFSQQVPQDSASFEEFLATAAATTLHSSSLPGNSLVRFRDESADLGVEFVYHQGHVSGTIGVRMQESTGGGVAVFDYDADDFPDLYFTQGHDWPHGSNFAVPTEKYQDRLFQNLGGKFRDVSRMAGIEFEEGFGQGCAAGDFDNDGFPDLYIANIGKNQLLLNQGDGTFKDASEALPPKANPWTSSCLIADLDNDGNPDLFDVNYLEGASLFQRICNETECTPQGYQPAPDRLLLSRGDGSLKVFELETDARWGAGLGIVAFQIDDPLATQLQAIGSGDAPRDDLPRRPVRLSLFIANDHEPNFFLINSPAEAPGSLVFTDEAFLRGVAVNKEGRPTASMGVACGDANGDRLLDLFVTNYKNEASDLYLQMAGGLFEDAIAGSGLLIPGLPYVKWGAQFLDSENDGDLDLVVANGHVGDFHIPGIECYMPTQFFRNDGGGRFAEIPANEIGEFFDRRLLGRTVALVDWNRDGLTDFVASPIASSAAILTNQTLDAGNSLAIRLHAVSTARDAIGASITFTTASRQFHQQLTAGDGYQASNERILRFGLGNDTEAGELVVHWPGGAIQVVGRLPANTLWDVVEGRRAVQTRSWSVRR